MFETGLKICCSYSQLLHLLPLSNPITISMHRNTDVQTLFIKGMFQRIKKYMHNTRSESVVGLSFLLGGLQLWKLQLINGYPYTRQSKISWTDHLRRQGCEKKTHFFPLSFCFLLKTPWYILWFISKDALAASNF